MADMERGFKGVWIPTEIWLDGNLTALDKIILAEVDSLDQGERGCYASNKYLADFCGCSESKVSKSIAFLVEYGWIYVESFDGRQRVLKSRIPHEEPPNELGRLAKNARQTSRKYEADSQKMPAINIDSIVDINIDNKTHLESDFDSLWKEYPKKQGKDRAFKAYTKARKEGVADEVILKGIKAYKGYIAANHIEDRYIKQGGTWFYQQCWSDEYKASATSSGNKTRLQDRHDYDYDEIEKEIFGES